MKNTPKNILVIKWGALGDIVMSTPAIRALKETWPDSKVVLLGNSLMNQIAPSNSIVDELIIYDEKKYKGLKALYHLLKLILYIRKYNFDLAINLRWHSDRCAVITYLSGAKIRVGSGPQNMLGVYNIKVPFEKGRYHEVHRNLDIVKAVGANKINEVPFVYTTKENSVLVEKFFMENDLTTKNTICIHPGASKPIRAWLPERFKEIAEKIVEKYNLNIVVTWSGKEKEIAEYLKEKYPAKIIVAPKTNSIGELAALIKNCGMCITNCTGPMNVAVAVETPTCAILGSSHPDDWRPYGKIHRTIKSPLDLDSYTDELEGEAMKAVTVDQVWNIVDNRINELFLV